MEAKVGIFTVSAGKGDRVFIKCADNDLIGHPAEVCGMNGLLIYGVNNAKDLAAAIIEFDRKMFEADSVEARAKRAESIGD